MEDLILLTPSILMQCGFYLDYDCDNRCFNDKYIKL